MDNLTKTDLIKNIAQSTKLTKVDVEKVLNSVLQSIQGALEESKNVTLVGFGTFTVSQRKARNGRNPKTGALIKIPASTVPKFRAGKNLREAVN